MTRVRSRYGASSGVASGRTNAPGEPVLAAEGLWLYRRGGWFGLRPAKPGLVDVSLSFYAGEMVCIMGESGSGKSTLLRILALLSRQSDGRLRVLGRDVATLSRAERDDLRTSALMYSPQRHFGLLAGTALGNVTYWLERLDGLRREDAEHAARRALRLAGLPADRDEQRVDGILSGGERARVALGVAFARRCRIFLADEPFEGLPADAYLPLVATFRALADSGVAVIAVLHQDDVRDYFDRIVELRNGRIVSETRNPRPAAPPTPTAAPLGDIGPPAARSRRRSGRRLLWAIVALLIVALLVVRRPSQLLGGGSGGTVPGNKPAAALIAVPVASVVGAGPMPAPTTAAAPTVGESAPLVESPTPTPHRRPTATAAASTITPRPDVARPTRTPTPVPAGAASLGAAGEQPAIVPGGPSNESGSVPPVGSSLAFAASDWSGGWYRADANWCGRPWTALYGANSGYQSATLTFTLDAAPSGATLYLTGLDDELPGSVSISIVVNGVETFVGGSPFESVASLPCGADAPWSTVPLAIPRGLLRQGTNQITVVNDEPTGKFSEPPYVMLADARLVGDDGG